MFRMKLSRKITAFLGLVIVSCMLGCSSMDEVSPGLPNIILVMADDQGWGDMRTTATLF